MSDNSKTPEQWKAAQQRAERKARLAKMKAKDGGKKQIRTSNPLARWLVISGLIIVLLIVGLWAVANSGVPQRKLTAAVVGPVEVKAVDINYYYYQQMVNRYGLNPADPETKETLKAPSGVEGFKTNADYLKDQALQELQGDIMLADLAQKEQIELDSERLERINAYVSSLKAAASREGKSFENFLLGNFGPGINEDLLTEISYRLLLADKYANDKADSFVFSSAELEEGYARDPDGYDVVDYRIFTFAAETKSGATEAEKTKAMEEAGSKAEEMLDKITDDESFRQLSQEYAKDDEKELYQNNDISLHKGRHMSEVPVLAQKNWLFDEDREPGDKTVIESVSSYYVLMFTGRSRPDYERVDVRHILLVADRNQGTEEQIEAARKKADEVLAEYKKGDQTQEAFAELAMLNSADGNAAEGGLYTGISLGQMVSEFEDWCFDPQRKTGDTGIVQTDFGFHVMYYVGTSGLDWVLNVEQTLRNEAFQAFIDQELENYAYTVRPFGYRFVG
jgi:hypothetical protein